MKRKPRPQTIDTGWSSGEIAEIITSPGADEVNPAYIFSGTDARLLVAILDGMIDARAAALTALANRGLNQRGKWVGFTVAAELAAATK